MTDDEITRIKTRERVDGANTPNGQLITEAGPSNRPPSGLAGRERKLRVDECAQLDLMALRKAGAFQRDKGPLWIGRATVPKPRAFTSRSIELRICVVRPESGRVRGLLLFYKHPQTGEDMGYPVLITSTPCHLGGHRLWFQCPGVVDHRPCQRRCRILYLPPGGRCFACRECHRLTYETRQRHRDRWFEFWRTYDFLLEELENPTPLAVDPKRKSRLRAMERVEADIKAVAPREESSQKLPQTQHPQKRTRRDGSPDGLTHQKGKLERG